MTRKGSCLFSKRRATLPLCGAILMTLLFSVPRAADAQAVLQITPGSISVFAAGSGTCPSPVSYLRGGHVQPQVRRGGVKPLAQGDGCQASIYANLQTVYDVTTDATGNVYIVDYPNNVVRIVHANGNIFTFAGGGTGCPGQTDAIGDGCLATQAVLNGPSAIAFDAGGNAYIAEYGVVGNITPRVRKVDTSGIITLFAGNGVNAYSGDNGPATSASMQEPTGVATDTTGNVYIIDLAASVVRKVDTTGTITTVAGGGTGCAGQTDSAGDGCLAKSAVLNNPFGIAVDSAGNLYIADTNNNRIRKVTTGTNIITTIAGTGAQGASGDNGPATAAELSYPERVVLDAAGNLYLSDSFNQRIRKIDTSGTITTVAGGGPGCTSTPCSALEDPGTNGSGNLVGLALDASGNLYLGAGDQVEIAGPQGAMAFPNTIVGQSVTKTFLFNNPGTASDTLPSTATGYSIAGNGDFTITGGTCLTNNVLAVHASCTLQATFAPVAPGERLGLVSFTDTSDGSPHSMNLYGQGYVVQSQTITFPAISNTTYGAAPEALSATASSGLPVTYSIVSGPGTISGNNVNITGAGTIVVQADQAGNAAYTAAAPVQQSFTVAKAILTVRANQIERYTDQLNPPPLTYTMSGFMFGTDSQINSTTGQPALTTNAPANPPVGSYNITISQGTLASANYAFSFINSFLIISDPTPATTTLALSTTTATTGQMVTLTATVTTIEPLVPGRVTFVDSNGGVIGHAQIAGQYPGYGYTTSNAAITRAFPPGVHVITANYDGTGGYTASSSAPQTLTVTGTLPSYTTLTSAQNATNPANNDLTAVVLGSGTQTPAGTVNFNDLLTSATLGSVTSTAAGSGFRMNQLPTGVTAGHIAVADLNNDGIPDIVATDHANVDVFWGQPNGTYSSPDVYTVGTNLQSIALADFNQDGTIDIAVADATTGSVIILYGDSLYNDFSSHVTLEIPSPSVPVGLAAADFDGDGVADLAVAQNNGQNLVTVLMNDGTGNFLYPQNYGTGSGQDITVGDFNADGNQDLAVSTGSNVEMLLGRGDGTFQPQITSAASGSAITSADFNGDGKLDVALANSTSVTVALGKGDGTFNAPATVPVTTVASSIASADFNQDRHADIVTSNAGLGNHTTSVLLGAGDGTFNATHVYNAGGAPGAVSVADLNGDDMPDIVMLDPSVNQFTTFAGGTLSTASLANVSIIGTGIHPVAATYVPGAGSNYASSTSNSVNINAQPPTLTGILPLEIAAGANGLTITVNGANFSPYALVLANGAQLATTYVSATQLTATVPAALLVQPTAIQIQVLDQDLLTSAATLTVVPDVVLSSLKPALAVAQSGSTTITATGANFTATTVLRFNGAALQTTFTSATQLSATIPAANLASAQTAQITAFDPASGSLSAAVPFTVLPSPSVVFSGPPTSPAATQPSLTFQLSQPYPIALAGTMTLTFTPSQGEPDDPSIQFASGGRTFNFTLAANSSTTPAVQIQSGTVAGNITVTLTLTASGVNVTPSSIVPVVINIPKSTPIITAQHIVRNGTTITIYVTGYSTSRDMTNAYFDFTPATGAKLSVSNFTVPVGTLFTGWFSSAASNQYGSAFTYFQSFTLNNDAASIGSVTVTLENSQGKSEQEVVQ